MSIFESGLKVTAGLVGAGVAAGIYMASSGGDGDHAFRNTIETRLSGAATGGGFSAKDIRTEVLHAPSKDALEVAEYNMAENLGAKDPSKPDARTMANVSCAIAALSFTKEDAHGGEAKWLAGHEAEVAENDDLAENRFKAAANACGGLLLGGVGEGTRAFVVPVAPR